MQAFRAYRPALLALPLLLFLLAACSDLGDTCPVWPTQAEARTIDAGEAPTYVTEMTGFLDAIVPRIRAATQAGERRKVAATQADICRFNARWPIQAQKNQPFARPYAWCIFAAQSAYFVGATLDRTPAGGLNYDKVLEGYADKCRAQLQGRPLNAVGK